MKKEPILTMKNSKQAMLAAKTTKIKPSLSSVIALFPDPRRPHHPHRVCRRVRSGQGEPQPGFVGTLWSFTLYTSGCSRQRAQPSLDPCRGTAAGDGGGHSPLAPRGGEAVGSPARTAPRRDRAHPALSGQPQRRAGQKNTSQSAKYLIS